MVERRKGIGYIIEALAALLVLFIFVIGNNPVEPATDWNDFQDQVMSQDITLVMEKSGDIDDFVRNGETGSMTTLSETLSDGRLSVSGSIENVPITTQVVGFHTLEDDRNNVTLRPVEEVNNNQCYQDNDLEEIESEEGEIHRSENAVDGSYLYVADTDPEISGGNEEIDYDSVWVDNQTRCQFSASEGPYYIGDFFYWGGEHYDVNQFYNESSPKQLELFLSSQIQELRPELRSRMNGIETGTVVDTVAVEREDLQAYDILVFRERQSLNDIEENRERIQKFMSDGSVLLMMELRREDFYEPTGETTSYPTSYETSFEGSDPDWYCYNSNAEENPNTCTSNSNTEPREGSELVEVAHENGVCGYAGMTKEFNENYDSISFDAKVDLNNRRISPPPDSSSRGGEAHILIEEENNIYEVKEWEASYFNTEFNWQRYNLDVSDYGEEFKLIIGSRLTTSLCRNEEYGFQILLDDLAMDGTGRNDIYTSRDNFLTSTGLKWVNLGYAASPSDPAGGKFNPNRQSGELETYFQGMEGDASQLNLRPSGSVTSSNSQNLKSGTPLLSTGTGAYDRTEWNATNYDMNEVDPESVEGKPESECLGDSSSSALTEGEFDFHDYQSNSFVPYDVINIQLSDDPDTCGVDYVRAVEIDKDEDGDYDESDEGPFLDGEQVRVENKTFTINFPTQDALETGDAVEFVYNGESDIESINYRTSFEEFEGERLARMEYKSNYGLEEKKMIAAVTHWLSEDNAQFGDQRDAEISTEVVGGVKENTFIPYRVSLRWR